MTRRPPTSTLFPYTRSSDLIADAVDDKRLDRGGIRRRFMIPEADQEIACETHTLPAEEQLDRKSTRLNSSHPSISYAVFCLKKKNRNHVSSPSMPSSIALLI